MARILIVDKSFAVGGIQTSLINMVKEMKDKHEIDVLMFHNGGILKNRFPDGVKIIEPSFLMRLHGMNASEAKKKGFFTYVMRMLTGVFDRLFTNRFSIWFALLFQKMLKGYDVAIAFHQEDAPRATVSGFYRFVSKKTDAPIKIGWIHYVPGAVSFDDRKNIKYMKKMDKLVCVSKSLAVEFAKKHESLSDKVEYCYNFIPYDKIKEKSEEPQSVPFLSNKFVCFSACRLSEEKALVRGINAMASAFKKYEDLVWYIAGEGVERENIERVINESGLGSQIVLIGHQANPYSYMRNADLVINVSYHEAAPMVFLESKAVGTPVFATRTVSALELIGEEYADFICENSESGIREAFDRLIDNRDRVENAKKQLKKLCNTNAESLKKIDEMIGR